MIKLGDSNNPHTKTAVIDEAPWNLDDNQISCIAMAGFDWNKGKVGGQKPQSKLPPPQCPAVLIAPPNPAVLTARRSREGRARELNSSVDCLPRVQAGDARGREGGREKKGERE